jgi:phosphoglycerol transferase MdoB-like AlkP superfamily enzyme
MEKVFLFAFATTVLFSIFKFAEMKFIENEIKPLKHFVRDAVMAFISSFLCALVLLKFDTNIDDFVSILTNVKTLNPDTTQIFTGVPDF